MAGRGSSSSSSRRDKHNNGDKYKGTYVGKLSTLEHKVTGHVYSIDNITIYIEGFTYDGEAPGKGGVGE